MARVQTSISMEDTTLYAIEASRGDMKLSHFIELAVLEYLNKEEVDEDE